ncbi:ethanolamine ammonia-lyase subunit EutC [Lysinibacillus louembei]|uniref:Ethanolamine ammonia-lyase small subunit n=1 Tax=Lysinibacillus louembei TaxID=1470088 RepID=A0ABZ0RWG9_9BACI|nr:ethanolamine ammonia-lyase subunit EutC [Lysinibacillus louembei]WPK11576.1 ethanolamine ammonia-lyase subunit EutC [Lysinibacillus louembei]
MNEELVAKITQLVMEKMNGQAEPQQTAETQQSNTTLRILETPDTVVADESNTLIKLYSSAPASEQTSYAEPNAKAFRFEEDNLSESVQAARKNTPARIGVGRAGTRPKTKTWLQFRLDHAAAVDAVYGEVSEELLQKLNVSTVTTRVTDKEEYITRPDLGRRLSDESKEFIQANCKSNPQVQIIISNGLSASAIEENIMDVYLSLQQSLSNLNIEMGTTFYIDKGRVALMDEIGEILQPEVVVYLIGERPGLVSAESMSAYLCYKPRIGTVEAERMVISNIHKGGIPPLEAGAYLGTVVQRILQHKASGVALVEKES